VTLASAAPTFTVHPAPPLTTPRAEIVAWARGEIARVRTWMVEANAIGRGIELIQTHSAALDTVIERLFAWVLAQSDGEPPGGLAVVAQGGYGRRQMCLHSDVDLLLLVGDSPTPKTEARVKLLVQLLWDVGGDIGHAMKTVREALTVVGGDFVQMTALFESRLVAGDAALAEALHTGLRRRVQREVLGAYLRGRVDEMRGRHARYGNTVYLLEPNVKEGEGGLRDVHVCQWIAFACLGSGELAALSNAEVLSDGELARLTEAWDFLLVVRNALHALAGRRVDTLDFARQGPVAKALGLQPDANHALPEEQLLHLFHRHARVVDALTERAVRLLPRRTSMAARLTSRFTDKRIRGGWVSRRREIAPAREKPEDLFRRDPGQMMEICAVARERGLRLSDDTAEAIRRVAPLCDDAFRADPANCERLLRILRGPAHTVETIRVMADTGLLGAHLPEFRRLEDLVRIDHYHRYTVNEHTIKCLEVAEDLITGDLDEREPGLAEAAHQIERWDLLMFGLLLHDIGKGEGRGHVMRGGQIAQRVAQRIGLDRDEAETLRQLVLGHLWLPHLAFRRDIGDPAVIEGLAQQVGHVELLRMLFVLTFADMSGVNPDNWTAWKGQLLWGLYTATLDRLAGQGEEVEDEGPALEEITERVLAHIDPQETSLRERATTLVSSASDRYRRSVSPARMAGHARLLARITDETRAVWEIAHPEKCNFSEITVATRDETGVFTLLCGALASKQINILSAQAYSTDDGFAVDTFQVTATKGGQLPPGLVLDRVQRLVNEVLSGERSADETFPVRLGPPAVGPERLALAPTQILFDHTISAHCTVLEVRTFDRTGLLHALTHTITKANLSIYLAMISTESYRVVDVFYLTDLDNMKIDDQRTLKALEVELTRLLAVGESAPER
jgi:[protein-PII] uridylyltransferase